MIGHTLPISAMPGTIRGDYASDSPEYATREGRAVRNLVHASAASADAVRELDPLVPRL
jgi:nucleoside-diphosphate kinase